MDYRLKSFGLIIFCCLFSVTALSQTINRAEYFIDSDPGNGNGNAVTVSTPSDNVNLNFNINTNALSTGFHILGFRLRQNNGLWGHPSHTFFYITPLTPSATSLVGAEYFFDNDPGFGNGTPFSFTPGATVTIPALNINIGSLSPGFHFVSFRFRDDRGNWTHASAQSFYVIPPLTSDPAISITRIEYFFNTDLGPGNNSSLPITAGSPQSNSFPITLPGSLTAGFHKIGFRYRDDKGRWSHAETRSFYIAPPISSVNRQIVAAEYYIDSPLGTGTPILIPGITPGATIDQLVALDMTGVPTGNHTLSIRIKDSEGLWSYLVTENFSVSACTPPSPPAAQGVSRCNEGTVTLNATGATGTQLYRWYDDPVLNNLLFTGPSYTTPLLTASRNYYVSIFDPGTNCESARVTVTAVVVNIPKPSINPSGSLSICKGSAVFLSAPSGFTQYIWTKDGTAISDTTQQILASQSGSYTLRVSDGTCQSEASDAFVLTAIPAPAKPIAPDVSRCNEGAVNLTVTGATGAQLYHWYDDPDLNNLLFTGPSFTTPLLTASRNYYVSIFDPGTNCESSRVSVTAVVVNIAKPSINSSGSLSICEGSVVYLSAPSGFTQYIWTKDGTVLPDTTQQILASQSGNYNLKVGDGTCQSEASDAFVLTAIPAPAKPVITVTGSTTICGTGSVDLTGPTDFEYLWSNGATTQTITVSQTGVFYLIVKTKGDNCPSLPSDPVVVNVLTPPCNGGNITNSPPAITSTPLASQIEGKVEFDLTQLLSDPDNNIDFTTLSVVNSITSRGVPASIDASYFLQIDYTGNPFTGTDRITLEVCDLSGSCVQQVIDIEVVGAVVVYNGITPDGDGINDFLLIKYINVVEGASKNRVMIFNRWGDVVFDVENYNNIDRVFTGLSKNGAELPSGTYFYKIEFSGNKPLTGFITIMR
jgi:gliding motility-associated-like protein